MRAAIAGTITAVALLLWTAPAAAQDADPPMEQDARDLLGDRAQPPSMDAMPSGVAETDNAGTMSATMTTSGETRTETVTEERSTEVRVGNDPDPVPASPSAGSPGWGRPGGGGSGWGRRGGDSGPEALAGDWTLMVDGGRACQVTLTDKPHFGGWSVETRGCEKDFFLASRWVGGSGEIQFTDAYDKVAGQLTRTGRNRYEGTRGSDGARIVLTR